AFRKPAVDQIVLSGASLQLGGKDYGWRQKLSLAVARFLSWVAPRFPIAMGLDSHGLSRDPEVIRRYDEDPLVKDRMSARFAAGLGEMIQDVGDAAGRIERPILILHGGEDPLCAPDGSRRFFAGLSSAIAEQSLLKIYPELRHEIFQEPERQTIWQDMLRFIER
ncbi:MAG: alpha/beta hydrolase, partial [Myxococcota bacterium]